MHRLWLEDRAQLTVQTENRIICPNCSADNDEGAKFCVQCGANLDNASENGHQSCVPPAERKLMGMRALRKLWTENYMMKAEKMSRGNCNRSCPGSVCNPFSDTLIDCAP